LAIDPAGAYVAFATSQRRLYLVANGQAPALLSSSLQAAVLAFDSTGERLFAADPTSQQVVVFDSGAGPTPFAPIPQTNGLALHPLGMALSAGDRYLLLAARDSQSVFIFDVGSQTLANTLSLAFAPTRFEPLSSDPSFVLNEGDRHEWLTILEGRETPRVYFVPAGEELTR
jgi:DNA-binding beta-propeller fold protein YncE